MKNYEKAKAYAFVIDRSFDITTDHRDLLHDAYLTWYNKTGMNLFDEPLYRIFRIISNCFRTKLAKNRYTYNHQESYRIYETFQDQCWDSTTPEVQLIGKDQLQVRIDKFYKKYPQHKERLLEVLRLMYEGYERDEIVGKLGITKGSIRWVLELFRR